MCVSNTMLAHSYPLIMKWEPNTLRMRLVWLPRACWCATELSVPAFAALVGPFEGEIPSNLLVNYNLGPEQLAGSVIRTWI